MDLPVRILSEPPDEPVVCVDGAFGTVGLHLSHWPGHRTPRALRHELSTGCALRFAALDAGERERLAAGAVAIVNNHVDTDGLCAAFAVRHPELALTHRDALLAAARAGDFFAPADDAAWAIDAIVTAFADRERSPVRARFAGASSAERHQIVHEAALERLPALLAGDLEPYRALWEPVVAAGHADLADLERAAREDEAALDLTTWTAPRDARSTRQGAAGTFDPGRHALFRSTPADRALVLGPGADGTTVRLVVSTLSWFDIDRPALPRPDLARAVERLNELEGTPPTGELAWRAQSPMNASPELWFGHAEQESFAEHNPSLAPSRLAPALLLGELRAALGARR